MCSEHMGHTHGHACRSGRRRSESTGMPPLTAARLCLEAPQMLLLSHMTCHMTQCKHVCGAQGAQNQWGVHMAVNVDPVAEGLRAQACHL